jgi:hypothetical protein
MPELQAAPEADLVGATSIWHIIANYDMQSRVQMCSITGTGKRPSDVGVFRPSTQLSYVDQEGSYDISQLAIEEAARALGWVSQDDVDAQHAELLSELTRRQTRIMQDGKKIKRLEAQLDELS